MMYKECTVRTARKPVYRAKEDLLLYRKGTAIGAIRLKRCEALKKANSDHTKY